MTTEKDIRKFMQENRIPVPRDSRFMDDLVRQIDLLPTPASLAGQTEESRLECMRLVQQIRESLKRQYLRQAIKALITSVAVCLCLFFGMILFVNPDTAASTPAAQFLMTWRYLVFAIVCCGILGLSLSRTELFRI